MMADERNFQFALLSVEDAEYGATNLADDERLALMACCVASQQNAGFKDYIDIRQTPCPECKGAGFTTGWGYWRFVCGAEILADGEKSEPCRRRPGGANA